MARLLLSKEYEVHGLVRRSSVNNFYRIEDLIYNDLVTLHYGDMLDQGNLINVLNLVKPDEIYNLAAQSDVKVSFECPEYTMNVNGGGVSKLLNAVKICNLMDKTKYYQAGTSEMFGNSVEYPQSEKTSFAPCSPYAVSKVVGHLETVNYRQNYDMFACNGILFNHESPMRGEEFVTRKVTLGLARIKLEQQQCLYLGNIYSCRDWGHAIDYVNAQWKMLQHDNPDDYVISNGVTYSVKDFINKVVQYLDIDLMWRGEGVNEVGINSDNGHEIIKIDKRFFRPNEVNVLQGDSSKARAVLNWKPDISFDGLVQDMVNADMKKVSHDRSVDDTF